MGRIYLYEEESLSQEDAKIFFTQPDFKMLTVENRRLVCKLNEAFGSPKEAIPWLKEYQDKEVFVFHSDRDILLFIKENWFKSVDMEKDFHEWGTFNLSALCSTYCQDQPFYSEKPLLAHTEDYPEYILDTSEYIEDQQTVFKSNGLCVVNTAEDRETKFGYKIRNLLNLFLNIERLHFSRELLKSNEVKNKAYEIVDFIIKNSKSLKEIVISTSLEQDFCVNEEALNNSIEEKKGILGEVFFNNFYVDHIEPRDLKDIGFYRKFYFKSKVDRYKIDTKTVELQLAAAMSSSVGSFRLSTIVYEGNKDYYVVNPGSMHIEDVELTGDFLFFSFKVFLYLHH